MATVRLHRVGRLCRGEEAIIVILSLRVHRPMVRLTGLVNLANTTPFADLFVFVC
jgi:hypothetical protein